MSGLIIKDLWVLRKQLGMLLTLIAFYLVFAVLSGDFGIAGGIIIFIAVLPPITSLSYDEHSKWDRYALSLPLSRKSVVLSKYCLAILLSFAATALVFSANLILAPFLGSGEVNYAEITATSLGVAGIGLLFLSVLLPAIYKFGVEKARLLMMGFAFLPTLFFLVLSKMGLLLPIPSGPVLRYLLFAAPFVVILLLLLSIWLSIKIYENKEF